LTVHTTSNPASKSASNGRKSIPREHLRPLHLQLRTPTRTSFRESGAEKAKTLVKQRPNADAFYRKNDHDFTSNHLRHQGPLHLPMTYSTPHLPPLPRKCSRAKRVPNPPNPRKCPETGAPRKNIARNPPPSLSDTPNFIRGLHGEYLVSWGQNLLAFAINPSAGFQEPMTSTSSWPGYLPPSMYDLQHKLR
jgi:hypothetical protein